MTLQLRDLELALTIVQAVLSGILVVLVMNLLLGRRRP